MFFLPRITGFQIFTRPSYGFAKKRPCDQPIHTWSSQVDRRIFDIELEDYQEDEDLDDGDALEWEEAMDDLEMDFDFLEK